MFDTWSALVRAPVSIFPRRRRMPQSGKSTSSAKPIKIEGVCTG
jgi:hypothetical protein